MTDEAAFGISLWTTDIPALAEFLVDIAGMELEQRIPGYAALTVDGVRVYLHADETFRGHPWYDALTREGVARGIGAELRVRVDDVDGAYARALRRGGLAIEAPWDVDGIRECQVMGPDGYLMTLWQPSLP